MTFDALMPSFHARDGALQNRQKSGLSSEGWTARWAPAVLFLALGCSSACMDRAPSDGDASVGGGGSSGGITLGPPGDTFIGPLEDFEAARLQPAYVLANGSQAPLTWEVRVAVPWLTLAGPEGGVLAPGDSVEVPLHVDPYRASELGEPALGAVVFLESGSGAVLGTRTVTVDSSFGGSGGGGWTSFTPSVDTRTVFVSSSVGDDRNDGLSVATPRRTLAAGQALLRHGFPDWLLLRRGDVWRESLGQWKKSGRAQDEPMLVSTYGDAEARPRLETGSSGGLWTNGGGASPATIDYLAIVGLHFRPEAFSGVGDCVGAQLLQPGSHFLIEDCLFEGYSTNLVFQGFGGRHADFRLRRSVIVDAHSVHGTGAHPQGLYAYAVDGLLIEESVFDHNGWSASVPDAGPDIYSHNLYIDNDNTGVVVRGNIIANASSHGVQLRPGGSVVNNLFLRNSIALSVGGGNSPEPGGVRADVRGNVILGGKDIDAANPRGWGLWFANIASGRVAHNVVANNIQGTQPSVLTLAGAHVGDTRPSIGVHLLVIERNVFHDWGGSFVVEGDASQITDVELLENDLQNRVLPDPLLQHSDSDSLAGIRSARNRFFSALLPTPAWTEIGATARDIVYWKAEVGDATSVVQPVNYGEPQRSMASYNALLGGSFSLRAFLAEARQQSSRNWRPEYLAVRANRYVRNGF